MHLYVSAIASVPAAMVTVGLVLRTVVLAICRMYGKLEDRRGLESAVRNTEPGDRAGIIRAYAECLAATHRPRYRRGT
jgi:hypothetical protein